MAVFGLITEGKTDQIIIENILAGYFDDPDIIVNWLLPLRDETDKHRIENYDKSKFIQRNQQADSRSSK